MGSKSAVIVCEDATLRLGLRRGDFERFQDDRSAMRVGRHGYWSTPAVRRLRRAVRRASQASSNFADPFDRAAFAGPLINQAAVDKVTHYNQLAVKEGAEVLLDGGRMTDAEHADGFFVSPFVYRQQYGPGVRTIREEVFGPHVALIPFEDDDEAIRIYNDTPYGLSMAVDHRRLSPLALYRDECDYGMGYVNLPCIGAEVHLPFGGVKRSGNGQPSAAGIGRCGDAQDGVHGESRSQHHDGPGDEREGGVGLRLEATGLRYEELAWPRGIFVPRLPQACSLRPQAS